jgi:hypothetical protein
MNMSMPPNAQFNGTQPQPNFLPVGMTSMGLDGSFPMNNMMYPPNLQYGQYMYASLLSVDFSCFPPGSPC